MKYLTHPGMDSDLSATDPDLIDWDSYGVAMRHRDFQAEANALVDPNLCTLRLIGGPGCGLVLQGQAVHEDYVTSSTDPESAWFGTHVYVLDVEGDLDLDEADLDNGIYRAYYGGERDA